MSCRRGLPPKHSSLLAKNALFLGFYWWEDPLIRYSIPRATAMSTLPRLRSPIACLSLMSIILLDFCYVSFSLLGYGSTRSGSTPDTSPHLPYLLIILSCFCYVSLRYGVHLYCKESNPIKLPALPL
jgi:hypothetical protein